ncbi:MAG: YHS domain-containing protein, partial [Myxococcales bacterium]|nr:YHS domain-containing protein [Myxococcales bacterium]
SPLTACAPAGPADPWARVPLADGATAASTRTPPAAFRNAAGEVACPVMGMAMAGPDAATSYADHAGIRYFFCCDSCEKLFLEAPETYANGAYLDAHALDPTAPANCSASG